MQELHRWTGDEPADPPTLPLLYNIVYCSRASGTLDQAALQRIVATAGEEPALLLPPGCANEFPARNVSCPRLPSPQSSMIALGRTARPPT